MQPILRGTKIIAFLLTVALTSLSITLSNSRPTQAESLLYKVGCVVGSLLSYECQKSTPPAQSPSETPAQPAHTDDKAGTDTGTTGSSDSKQAVPSPAPIEMDKKLTAELPAIPEIETVGSMSGTSGPAYAFPLSRAPTSTQQVLGAETPAVVAPSGEGWKIYGVAWYWWALVLGGIGALYIGTKAWITKSFLTLVK